MKHSEKVCTIVGVGPGISFSVAKRFAREGFSIALIARRVENIQRYAQQLIDMGAFAKAYAADAGDFIRNVLLAISTVHDLGNLNMPSIFIVLDATSIRCS